jgi:hypothetical protein
MPSLQLDAVGTGSMVGRRGAPTPYWTGRGGGGGVFRGPLLKYLGQKIPSFTFVIPMSKF